MIVSFFLFHLAGTRGFCLESKIFPCTKILCVNYLKKKKKERLNLIIFSKEFYVIFHIIDLYRIKFIMTFLYAKFFIDGCENRFVCSKILNIIQLFHRYRSHLDATWIRKTSIRRASRDKKLV